jgi:hypothetical protein
MIRGWIGYVHTSAPLGRVALWGLRLSNIERRMPAQSARCLYVRLNPVPRIDRAMDI